MYSYGAVKEVVDCEILDFIVLKGIEYTYRVWQLMGRAFTNYIDRFLAFFDHLPPYVDILYLINIDEKSTFMDYLPTSSCQRSL